MGDTKLTSRTAELPGLPGFFRSHVETPRKNTQLDSLVICLQSSHKGGRLIVKHGGHEVKYDWDAPETAAIIQWLPSTATVSARSTK